MKLLTVAIPCYNSEEYMRRAIDSVLVCKDELELLIIDDGSKDDTYRIAKEYEEANPDCVRAIHKENGGHGSAVNIGIQEAEGLYFKVLDSDDWFDKESFISVIDHLKNFLQDGEVLDMLVSNYVYEKPSKNKQKVMNYFGAIPRNKVVTWKNRMHFGTFQNLLMHSLIYRTKLLRDCQLKLPEHTFYVDNIFAYYPLPHVHRFYYLDVDLYRYYIGRSDQSVNETIMTSRIDQQIKITKLMISYYNPYSFREKSLKNYMVKYLSTMMIVTSTLLINEGSEESLKKRDELWLYLKESNLHLYKTVTHRKYGYSMQMNNRIGNSVVIKTYKILNKIYGFN